MPELNFKKCAQFGWLCLWIFISYWFNECSRLLSSARTLAKAVSSLSRPFKCPLSIYFIDERERDWLICVFVDRSSIIDEQIWLVDIFSRQFELFTVFGHHHHKHLFIFGQCSFDWENNVKNSSKHINTRTGRLNGWVREMSAAPEKSLIFSGWLQNRRKND